MTAPFLEINESPKFTRYVQTTADTLSTPKAVNYLGVRLNPRLTFWVQIQHEAGKAAKINSELSRLMANIGYRHSIRPNKKRYDNSMATKLGE